MKITLNIKLYKKAYDNYYKIFSLLSNKLKVLVIILICCLIITSVSELIGIASLIPLINSLSDKDFINNVFLGDFLNFVSDIFGLDSLFILTSGTVFLILFAYVARLTSNYYTYYISNLIGLYLHDVALNSFLRLSYFEQNIKLTANLAHCLTNQIQQVVTGYIYPLLSLLSSIFIVLIFASGLLIFSPFITILIICFSISFYIIVGSYFSNFLLKGGRADNINLNDHLSLVSNIKSYKKQLKLYSLEEFIFKRLSNLQKLIRRFNTNKNFIGTLTRPILELFILISFAIFIFIISFQDNSADKLTELIFIIVVSQKLFPVFQAIYIANNNIITGIFPASDVLEYCNIRSNIKKTIKHVNHKKIKKINVNDIYFKYSKNTNKYIFRSFSYQFEFGKSYCISAPSGYGKSTLIDLLLGLLKPNKGSILYSGDNISFKAGEFSKDEFISYVPQSNFFLDGDLRFILTCNYRGKKFTDKQIIDKCKIACIDNSIYDSKKGLSKYCSNNLSEFSGGQKQRIGIAQALLNPSVRLLILDETFSNIDKPIIKKILKNIKINFPNLTIVMVTHDESIIPEYFEKINLSGKSDQ